MGVQLEKSALESAALQYTSVETDGGDARSKAESSEIAMKRVLRFVLWGLIRRYAPEATPDQRRCVGWCAVRLLRLLTFP